VSKRRRRRRPNLPTGTTSAARRAAESKQIDLAEEYAYVTADLGRIGIIAGVLLAGLVALSFILR
jgi:acyl-CoA synthetase (NDP forming)